MSEGKICLKEGGEYPVKTQRAKEVLMLLDSGEDTLNNLCSIVASVAEKEGINKEQLWRELEPWL